MTTSSQLPVVPLCSLLLLGVAGAAQAADPVATQAATEHQVVNEGIAWRNEVEADEKALRLAFERLDQAIVLIATDNLHGERLTILELRRVVRQMRQQVPRVVAAHQETLAATKAYGESVRAAATLLLAAAKRFEQYAADEPYYELREDYRLWGESIRAIAKKYQQQAENIPATVTTVSENLAYVVRTERQLERVERLLDIVPEEGVGTDQFLTRLASYVKSFAAFRERLRALHGRTVGIERMTASSGTPTTGASEVVTAEADAMPLAKLLRSKPTLPRCGLHDSTRAAVNAPLLDEHTLVGHWRLMFLNSRVRLKVQEHSGKLALSLARNHQDIAIVQGFITGSGRHRLVRDLVFGMRNGQRLKIGNCQATVVNANELSISVRMVFGNSSRGFFMSAQKTVKLYRVG